MVLLSYLYFLLSACAMKLMPKDVVLSFYLTFCLTSIINKEFKEMHGFTLGLALHG